MKSLQRAFGWPLIALGGVWFLVIIFVMLFDERDPFLFGPVGRRVIGGALIALTIWFGWDDLQRWRKKSSEGRKR